MKKVVIGIFLAMLLLIIVMLGYVKTALPNVGEAPDLTVVPTPEKVARGEYLANHVAVCIDCHSTRDWSKYAGPPMEGTFGKGGEVFDERFGFPGKYTSKNITPYGIGDWTDGEVFRAITTGVDRDGNALFPIMPAHYYGQMDKNDIECIIAYIRTLDPVEFEPEASKSNFPMNFIINTIPHSATFTDLPPATDSLAYGKYVITSAGCVECHSQVNKGQIIPGKEYGGGRPFPMGGGKVVVSANITPDKETGIGNWTKEAFIQLFRSHADSVSLNTTLAEGANNTVMPWTMYAGMTDQDLGAIYDYLQSIAPITNKVEKFKTVAE